jgi:hypothetical protein
VAQFQNGCSYEGEFKDDMYDGIGNFNCPSGLSYEGQWKANKVRSSYYCRLD